MATKPFQIQSPEQIATDYGGNKQKIAQAMQNGLVDPTAGVLAGMFIDRMRSAQVQEQAPQQTVAQQVFAPPAPPQAPPAGSPSPSQAGGAPPLQGMPPQGAPPPGMGAPPPEIPPEMAGPPMADGGLASLPVPDSMYDTSMAEGGIVGFAAAGNVSAGMSDADYVRMLGHKESRNRDYNDDGTPVRNKKSGAMYRMQVLPSTARDPGYGVAPAKDDSPGEYNRVGEQLAIAWRRRFGNDKDSMASYNWGPGNVEKWIAGGRKGPMPKETQNYIGDAPVGESPKETAELAQNPDNTVYGAPLDFEGNYELIKKLGSPDRTEQDKYIEETRAQLDPKERKKLRDEAKWSALAQFGFRLAASKNPDFLGGVGEAGAATNPELASSLKELKANERELRKEIMSAEDIRNKDKQAILSGALDFYGSNAKVAESIANRQSQERTALSGQATQERIATAGNVSAEKIAQMGNEARIKAAQVAAAAGPQDRDTAAAGSLYTTLAQMQQQKPEMIGPFLATMGLPQYAGVDGKNMSPAALQTIANQAWEYQKGMARSAGMAQQTPLGLEGLQGGGGGAAPRPTAGTAPPAGFEMD